MVKRRLILVSKTNMGAPVTPQSKTNKVARLDPHLAEIEKYKEEVEQRYQGNWVYYILDKDRRSFQMLEEIREQNIDLKRENKEKDVQICKLLEQLDYMTQREKERETKENELAASKLKRKRVVKKPLREAVTSEEVAFILELADCVMQEAKTRARVKVAIALLYATGLRISNLLVFKKKNLQQLISEGECEIPLIKGGPKRNLLYIGSKGRIILRGLKAELEVLLQMQPTSDFPAFVSSVGSSKPISRKNFTEQINKVLKVASKKLGKVILSHSFRATYVTDLLGQGVAIERVQAIVGHASIRTTACYNRTRIPVSEYRSTVDLLNSDRIAKKKSS